MAVGKANERSVTRSNMVIRNRPELTAVFEMVCRKMDEAEADRNKKARAHSRRAVRRRHNDEVPRDEEARALAGHGAMRGDEGPRGAARRMQDEEVIPPVSIDEDVTLLRSILESASGLLSGGPDAKRDTLAFVEASIRVLSNRQTRLSDVPRFFLPEKAEFGDYKKLKEERLKRYCAIRSFDIEGLAFVTPPTNLKTYQLIDVTRPSDNDNQKAVSVAQLLVSETDNYLIGARATPPDPTEPGGFFVFSDVSLPPFFGKVHRMSISCRYSSIGKVGICTDSLRSLVEEILLLTPRSCTKLSTYVEELFELHMYLFGEFLRMQVCENLLQSDFTPFSKPIFLTAEILFYMRNWSYLSKVIFAFYLAIVEVSLGVFDSRDSFLKGRKQMVAAVLKFRKLGFALDILGDNGFFNLRQLVGRTLQLLKFDEGYVKRLIMRRNREHSGEIRDIQCFSSEESEDQDRGSQDKKDENDVKHDPLNDPKKIEEEWKFWKASLQSGRDMFINILLELNTGRSDEHQGLECQTSKLFSTHATSLSGGLSKGPSQPLAPRVKNSLSKRPADLKSTPKEVIADLGSHVSQSSTLPPPSVPGVGASVSDSVLTPSLEAHSQCEIISNKHPSRSQRAAGLVSDDVSAVPKDTSQPSVSPSIVLPSGSRPSSSYRSRSQQPGGSQKAVPNKEWKSKPTNKPTRAENVTHDDVPVTVKDAPQSVLVSTSIHKEVMSSEMDKKLGDMQLFDKKHVIIPDHLRVTESEKYGLSFGSFGIRFEHTSRFPNEHENEKSSMLPEYESSQEVEEVAEEPASSYQGASSIVEAVTEPGQQHLTAKMTGNISSQEVQQRNDFIANYYTYQPVADADGHLSPFTSPGAAVKSGNMSVPPTQTGQNQEELNSMALCSSGPTSLDTPAPGVVPSSSSIPQPFPVYRQPVGVHVPHYQPGFFPYNQNITPFYVPPHALHHFMGNAAFSQAPPPGSIYPPVSSGVVPPVNCSASAYKPGANTGSQTYAVAPGAYGTYGSSPYMYTNNNVVPSGPSAENGDVSGSQFKENNIYTAGQQSEGSGFWIPAAGRELSALQSSFFYGLPPQGQHLAFAAAQAGHGAYGGMYHPAQTLAGGSVHPLLQPSQTISGAVEMVGPPANAYQQPQHPQMNWPNY